MYPVEGPFLCRVIRKAVDLVYPKYELVGLENIPEEASIIVGNHSQAHGPIITEERLPFEHYTWCVAQMMDKAEVADYAYTDFWSQKPKAARWVYWLVSRIIPRPASYLMKNARTIPVYRDNRCITTFRRTMEKLDEGYHIVIYPEHYVRHNNILWEFQDRFIDIARMYYRKTGKYLSFVPMYLAPRLRKVFFGKAIRFDPEKPIKEERERICSALMDTITEIAISQPVHTVVPYPNISRKHYPKSLPLEVYNNENQI